MIQAVYQPCVIVIHGAMYHGKSTVAGELAFNSKNLLWFDVDDIKTQLFKDSPEMTPHFFSEENTRRTNAAYEEAASRALILFRQCIPTIFSGTFSWASFKAPFIKLIEEGKIPRDRLKIFDLKVDSHVEIKRRIRIRNNPNIDVKKKLKAYLWSKEQQKIAPWPEYMSPKSINAFHKLETVVARIAVDLTPFQQAA